MKQHSSKGCSANITFDVSVYNHIAVEIKDALQDLPGVSAGHFLRQSAVCLQLVFYRALGRKTNTIAQTCARGTSFSKGGESEKLNFEVAFICAVKGKISKSHIIFPMVPRHILWLWLWAIR